MTNVAQTESPHTPLMIGEAAVVALAQCDLDAGLLFCPCHKLTGNLLDRLATLGGVVIGVMHAAQTLDGGTHDVDRVGVANALGEHVLYAQYFKHCAHRPPCHNAS